MSTITSLQTTDTGLASRGIINTNFTNLNTDKLEKSGGTLTGEINFSGTTHAGVKLNSLTTTQRDALTPANGMIIYNSTTGQVEKYEAGAWVGATGVANATSSVEGIVELATQAEIDNDTAIGGTGAGLGITPDQLALSKYGTRLPSSDEKVGLGNTTSGTALSASNGIVDEADVSSAATANKVARRLAGGNITVVTESAGNNSTNAASTAYVDAGLGGLIEDVSGIIASDTTVLSAGAGTAHNSTTYTKVKEVLYNDYAGTVRITFTISESVSGGSYTFYGRVYKNGSAVGTERTINQDSTSASFTEDFSVATGDLLQIYTKVSNPAGGNVSMGSMILKYTKQLKAIVSTVNL